MCFRLRRPFLVDATSSLSGSASASSSVRRLSTSSRKLRQHRRQRSSASSSPWDAMPTRAPWSSAGVVEGGSISVPDESPGPVRRFSDTAYWSQGTNRVRRELEALVTATKARVRYSGYRYERDVAVSVESDGWEGEGEGDRPGTPTPREGWIIGVEEENWGARDEVQGRILMPVPR